MAELAVRTAYTNPARALSLATLKLTFPFWGVGFPVASIIKPAAVINGRF